MQAACAPSRLWIFFLCFPEVEASGFAFDPDNVLTVESQPFLEFLSPWKTARIFVASTLDYPLPEPLDYLLVNC